MLKQSSSKMKKVLAILLAVIFVVSVTAVAVNAANIKDKSKADSKDKSKADSKDKSKADSKSVASSIASLPIGLGWDGLSTEDGDEDATPCHWVWNGFSWQYTCSPYSAYPYI